MASKNNNHGGPRKGAGRPPKADELKISGLAIGAIIDAYGSEEDFWLHIAKESKASLPHLVKLLEYGYGKPKEVKTEEGTVIETPQIEVIIKK